MPYEPQPDGHVVLVKPAVDYGWLADQPAASRDEILKHAYETGAAIPKGLHLDQFGNTCIDDAGFRNLSVLRTGDGEIDHATVQRYRGQGYQVKERKDGTMYDLKIADSVFQRNQKAAVSTYEKRRDAARRITSRKKAPDGSAQDYEEVSRISGTPYEVRKDDDHVNLSPEDIS